MLISNILGTLDKKLENCNKKKEKLLSFARLIFNIILSKATEYNKLSSVAPITTGKEDANFSTTSGDYPFFTCGQDILKCDTPAFNGRAILIAGNGDFNVKHYNGSFNAYQRTYVLIPTDEKYYALIYFASQLAIQKFIRRSAGSIIKFITKSDIEEISIPVCKDNKLLLILNHCIEKIDLLDKEIELVIKEKNHLLPLLMNGQLQVIN